MPDFAEMPIEKVLSHMKNNTRSSLGDLQELTESIKTTGVQEPILVRNLEDDLNSVEVFAGFRRLEASKLAERTTIPVIVYPREEITKEKAIALNLTENVQREDLNPIDEANAYMRLRTEYNLSDDEICARIGIKKPRLIQRLRLLDLTTELQEALNEDKISMSAALEISKLPEDKHKKYIKLATDLKGERLRRLVEKELEKIANKAENDSERTPEDEEKAETSAAYTELSRNNRKNTDILAKYFEFGEKELDEIKSINWRALELEDLKVISRLFDIMVDIVPNQLEFIGNSEQNVVSIVEKRRDLDLESSIVQQSLVQSIKNRAQEFALLGAPKGKRPKVTHDMVEQAVDEFYGGAQKEE